VRRWAQRRPDAPAVRAGDRTLTYRELDELADRFAHQLARRGLPAETVVAVDDLRTVELPAMLLGVLRAGLAYLPVDPTQSVLPPAEAMAGAGARLRFVPGDNPGDDPGDEVPVLRADPRQPLVAGLAAAMRPGPEADQLAGVVWTSGATGAPIAVALSHGSLTAALTGMAQRLGLGNGDRLLAVTSVLTGRAGVEPLLPLVAGAELLLATGDQARDGRQLAGAIELHRPTVVPATPAVWRNLLAAGWTGAAGLTAVCDGEELTPALAAELLRATARVVHCYGLMEAGGYAVTHEVRAGDGPVPIGTPLDGLSAYVADPELRPAPDGQIGELCLAGAAMARGYPGRLDETGRRFVPDPWSGRPDARMVRTGDLVRRGPDGLLTHHGRLADRRSTVAGPVDPMTAERVVTALPSVAAALAVWRDDTPELDVFVQLDHRADASPATVRAAAEAALTELPVACHVTLTPRLPLTPAGRLDRHAAVRPPAMPIGREPATDEERRIAAVWSGVLSAPVTVADADFFDLGGHSLAVLRLTADLEESFGLAVPMAELFTHTTVASQAKLVERLYADLLAEVLAN
jgi:acyl-CoA synthetase (AMP-forming)/AMP-acid ligase II/acyl carrier protein